MEFSFFWVWTLLASLLCIGEFATKKFFFLPFALGAACGAIAEASNLNFILQIVIFLTVSLLAFFFLRPFFLKASREEDAEKGVNRLVGHCGIVCREIPAGEQGRVRIEREEWSAVAPGVPHALPVGASIEVLKVDGAVLKVRATKSICGGCTACKPDYDL